MTIAGLTMMVLAAAAPGAGAPARAAPPEICWLTSEPEALRIAAATGRPVLVDFWADWCSACAVLDRYVWTDPEVRGEATEFVALRIDGSEGSADLTSGRFDRAARRFGVAGLPTVILIDARGRELDRVEGAVPPGVMLAGAGTLVYVNAGTHLAAVDSLQGIVSPGLLGSFAAVGLLPLAARRALDAIRSRRATAGGARR